MHDRAQARRSHRRSPVRECRVRARELEWNHRKAPERQRRARRHRAGEPHVARCTNDRLEADVLRRRHGRYVQGMRKRLPDGDRAKEVSALVPQRPALAVVLDRERLILEHGGSRQRRWRPARTVPERGEIDERFERRARMPPRVGRPVELAHPVIAAPHQRPDLSGGGVQRDEYALHPTRPLGPTKMGVSTLELLELLGEHGLRGPLQYGIEARVDPESAQAGAACRLRLPELGEAVVAEVQADRRPRRYWPKYTVFK